jgi:hypothetical protein
MKSAFASLQDDSLASHPSAKSAEEWGTLLLFVIWISGRNASRPTLPQRAWKNGAPFVVCDLDFRSECLASHLSAKSAEEWGTLCCL